MSVIEHLFHIYWSFSFFSVDYLFISFDCFSIGLLTINF